jgi:hypothetical protein
MAVTYEQALAAVREEYEPGWDEGTFCIDDRMIRENDEFWVFLVGAREFLVDGDEDYELDGGLPIVRKSDGSVDMLASVEIAMDDTVRQRPNPNPTLQA